MHAQYKTRKRKDPLSENHGNSRKGQATNGTPGAPPRQITGCIRAKPRKKKRAKLIGAHGRKLLRRWRLAGSPTSGAPPSRRPYANERKRGNAQPVTGVISRQPSRAVGRTSETGKNSGNQRWDSDEGRGEPAPSKEKGVTIEARPRVRARKRAVAPGPCRTDGMSKKMRREKGRRGIRFGQRGSGEKTPGQRPRTE